ncbi:MAG TPA: hypothetical protein VFY90_04900 [Tepidiformaceae bacterium]|nr:hypothetical protein [Tepidiformaceae bacterium]
MTQLRPEVSPGKVFEYRVRAVNGASHSENKIHEDSIARQYGFRGGLVPGVTDYAYMTRPALDAFGPEWLERGAMNARFVKPLYDGELVTCRATVGDSGDLALEALNEQGELCAPGAASLPDRAPAAPAIADFPWREMPAADARPLADEQSLAVGTVLGSVDREFNLEAAAALTVEVPDDHPLYQDGAVAHPGFLIRFANEVLHRSVRMGPWIHTASQTQHFSLVRPGDQLSTRGRVLELFERKGHRYVVLDVATFANGERPVQRVRHTSIYQLRSPE